MIGKIPARLLLSLAFLAGATLRAQVPSPAHVLIVVEENHDFSQIVGSPAAPYINSLAAGGNAALFTKSFGLTHPSQPNYIMLFSGSAQGVADDALPSGLPFTAPNLGASLLHAGKSFTGFSEDLPSAGFNGTASGAYARKHNPWANWQNASANGIPPEANRPLANFPADFDSLPTLSFVIPNQNDDMHNGSDPGTIAAGDTWLRDHLDAYIQWAKRHNSLFILTFDEGTTSGDNRIATLFVGGMVAAGQYAETINHYSLLRTLEDMYGLPAAGNSASAQPITDCWSTPGGAGNAPALPGAPLLEQNYPNPFSLSTTIRYELPTLSHVALAVYDAFGREVARIVSGEKPPGIHDARFDAGNLPRGVYLYRLQTGTFTVTRRMVVGYSGG